MREAILTAARDLFVAQGCGQVSIRKIAERIEYRAAAVYSYCPGKGDILGALAEEGFTRRDSAIRAVEGTVDPLVDLRTYWWASEDVQRGGSRAICRRRLVGTRCGTRS